MSSHARLSALSALVLLGSCGGGTGPSTPPPPPPGPPPSGPAASVTIQSGDGQSGAPGGVLAVRPSVAVRDAGGRSVAGTQVTFVVEQGGGTLSAGSAVTGADGIAAAGEWTLGAGEGVHRVRATVAGLPSVLFSATALFPTTLHADTTLGTGGGTIRIQRPGDPLDGASLNVPGGAFPNAVQVRIESRPEATAPVLRSGRVAGPVLLISTDQGRLADPILVLTLPVRVPVDSFVAVFLRDPQSGRMEALPPVGVGATSVTVAARHFDASRLPGPVAAAATAPGSGHAPSNPLQVLVTFNALASIGLGVTTPFRPGTDDWEFPNHPTYLTPLGSRVGSSLSALHYFQANGTGALGLWGRMDQGPHWADNAQGVRLVAVAEQAIDWAAASRAATAVTQSAASRGFGSVDGAHFFTIAAAMQVTGQPQLIFGFGPQSLGMYALIVYQLDLNGLTAVDPNRPGVPVRIPFVNARFQPVPLSATPGAAIAQFSLAQTMGPSSVVNTPALAALFSKASAGTAGDAEFPGYALQYYDEETLAWRTITSSTLQLSWQDVQLRAMCPTCDRSIVSLTTNGLQALDVFDGAGNALASDRTVGAVRFRVPAGGRVGVHVLGGLRSCGSCQTDWLHVDFRYLAVQATRIFIAPDPVAGDAGTAVTLTAKNLDPGTPAGASYQWTFGDGTTKTVTGDSTVTHAWAAPGAYPVSVVVRRPDGSTFGRATGAASISQAVPVWRFTNLALTVTGTTFPDAVGTLSSWVNADITSLMDPILGAPHTGRLHYRGAPSTVAGTVFPQGVYVMGGYSGINDLGLDPAKPHAPLARPRQGPYVDQFEDLLTLDLPTQQGDLTRGTFGGTSVTRIRDLSGFPGVGGRHAVSHWEVTATKNGSQLTGTITYYLEQWAPDTRTCSPPGSLNCLAGFGGTMRWVYTFSAVRVK